MYVYLCVCVCVLSHVQLLMTLWTVAHQTLLSMRHSRQDYWSGLKFPTPGDLPDSGIEPVSLASLASAGGFFTTNTIWEAIYVCVYVCAYTHTLKLTWLNF